MTNRKEERDRPRRSVPFSLRRRASLLYRGRRGRILQEPLEVLRAAGAQLEVSPESRYVRASFDDGLLVEVAFTGRARLFGVLIDTMWVGRVGTLEQPVGELSYRFDKRRFVAKVPGLESLADRLSSDAGLTKLIGRGEIKTLKVTEALGGRQVEIVPLPGTITAVYLPPMPPFTVPFKPEEPRIHLALVRRILEIA